MDKLFITGLIWLALCFMSCQAQTVQSPDTIARKPAVAGSFYPSDKQALSTQLEKLFNEAEADTDQQPLAIIVPHAGYPFSGKVAASGFKQIDRNRRFNHVFLIGACHSTYFNGISVYTSGDFVTPLGRVPVDQLAAQLVNTEKILHSNKGPHVKEHSLEVELPFLQYWLRQPFTIVPILLGGSSPENSQKLASILKPYLTSDNLFIISSDFSHYPAYADAVEVDGITANAIVSNKADQFLKTMNSFSQEPSHYKPLLITPACGYTAILTLLHMTEDKPGIFYKKLLYENSGDSPYGDKQRVVGYQSFGVYSNLKTIQKNNFSLNAEEKKVLLQIARKTLSEYLASGKIPTIDETSLTSGLLVPAGAFVTLKKQEELRGCIGNFTPDRPLYQMVQSMAVASATNDSRFQPVTQPELHRLNIEISVLTPMQKIDDISQIELGKHGIYVKQGKRAGTFLPQVAEQTGWTREEFLGHCARDKAFIGWDGWKKADIYIYEALVFGEIDDPKIIK